MWTELDRAFNSFEGFTPAQRALCAKWHADVRGSSFIYTPYLHKHTNLPEVLINLISEYAVELETGTDTQDYGLKRHRGIRQNPRREIITINRTLLQNIHHGPYIKHLSECPLTFDHWSRLYTPSGPTKFLETTMGCYRKGIKIGLQLSGGRWYSIHFRGGSVHWDNCSGWEFDPKTVSPEYLVNPLNQEFINTFNPQHNYVELGP